MTRTFHLSFLVPLGTTVPDQYKTALIEQKEEDGKLKLVFDLPSERDRDVHAECADFFGVGFDFELHEVNLLLSKFSKGGPISYDEALLLKKDDVVWLTYAKDGRKLRINEPQMVRSAFDGRYIGFETCDFTPDESSGERQAEDTIKGRMALWRAVPR